MKKKQKPQHSDNVTRTKKYLQSAYTDAALSGNLDRCFRLVEQALDAGMSLVALYDDVLREVLVGQEKHWSYSSLADEHLVTAITQAVMSRLYVRLVERRRPNGLRAVIACVPGEYHSIGGAMVSDLLFEDGWETFYLGANVPIGSLTEFSQKYEARLIGLSISHSSRVDVCREAIAALRITYAGQREVAILVGGNPFREAPERCIITEADKCCGSGRDAVEAARSCLQQPVCRQHKLSCDYE